MQDFDPVHQLVVREPSQSRIPAHTFRISARDLARFGQLYLQQGRWNGRQIVPESWIASSWLSRSETGGGQGYGYLWWIYEPGSLPPHLAHLNRFHTYLARGTGGQALFVIPDAQLVVAHMADTDNGRAVAGAEVWRVVEQILAARQGTASNAPNLAPVHRRPLAEAAPPPLRPRVIVLRASQLERFVGEYVRESGAPLRVYRYEDGLFLIVPEAGEAELFPVGPAEFVIQVAPGASARFTEVEAGVLQLTITADGQTIVGQREGT
jgi:CubicO group peptidase (beta-lactamase class C family)